MANAGNDSLIFHDGAVLTGSFNGGSDDDTIDFSDYTSSRNVVLTSLGLTDGFTGTVNGISAASSTSKACWAAR